MPKVKEVVPEQLPTMEEIQATAKEDAGQRLETLELAVSEIAKGMQTLMNRMEQLPTVRQEVTEEYADVAPVSDAPSSGNPVIDVVQRELSSEFEVEMVPHQPGISFVLIIRAPERLRETKDDKHAKVIPYLEAETQARAYAKKVREYHIATANRKGLGSVFA